IELHKEGMELVGNAVEDEVAEGGAFDELAAEVSVLGGIEGDAFAKDATGGLDPEEVAGGVVFGEKPTDRPGGGPAIGAEDSTRSGLAGEVNIARRTE